MKKLAAFLLLIPTILCAQRFMVRFNTDTNRGFPVGWPLEASPTSSTTVAPGWDTNLTQSGVDSIANQLRPQLVAMESNRVQSAIVAENNRRKLLADFFDDFQVYEQGWKDGTNYNAATLQVILRKHNGALLLLKPMLRDLYESRNE